MQIGAKVRYALETWEVVGVHGKQLWLYSTNEGYDSAFVFEVEIIETPESGLLQALREILACEVGQGDGSVQDYRDEIREIATSAIAKATGAAS